MRNMNISQKNATSPVDYGEILKVELRLAVKGDVQMVVGKLCYAAASGGPGQESQLH